jgi:tetratricopeptide (TPR) repeat protein
MRTRSIVATLAALALPALVLLSLEPVVAAAGGDPGASPPPSNAPADAGKRYDPNNQTALSEFMDTCIEGSKQYVARDFKTAITTFRKAISQNAKSPLGYYLLGEAQLADGNLAEAEASWKQAEPLADAGNPLLRARVLFVMADVKERQKKWDEARTAWQTYNEFVARYGDAGVGFPASGASRVQAIEAMTKLTAEAEKVKQRIRDTADGGVFTAFDASSG